MSPIIENQFFSAAESEELSKRILKLEGSLTRENTLLHFLGYPYYVNALNKISRDNEKVKNFNQLMESEFPDVLKKLLLFFQSYLGEDVYLDKTVSYPGFHAIKIPAKNESMINFHQDTEFKDLSVDRPQFQISGPGPSFTVYLSNDPELEAGLLYLDGPGFNHERLINPQNKHERNTKLKLFSHYHPYKTGNIYIHQEVAHSIFAKNYSDFTKFRLSLQGHLTKTKRGYLLFW